MSFSYILELIFDFVDVIITYGNTVFTLFFSKIEDTQIGHKLPEVILNEIGELSIITFMFGAGIVLFIVCTIIKWFVGIVT